MIVRDDKRKEIVVAFRGTSELTDAITGESNDQMLIDRRSDQFSSQIFCSSLFLFVPLDSLAWATQKFILDSWTPTTLWPWMFYT